MEIINSGIGVITDICRLEQAFTHLRVMESIEARQDYMCCSTCGHHGMREHVDKGDKGYVFYHSKAAEGLLETGTVFLQHGAFGKHSSKKVAQTICDVLREYGFEPEWDGNIGKCIVLKVIEEIPSDEEEDEK